MRSYLVSAGRRRSSSAGDLCLALISVTDASRALSQSNRLIALGVTHADGSANAGDAPHGGSISRSTVLKYVINKPAYRWELMGAGDVAIEEAGNSWPIYTAPQGMPSDARPRSSRPWARNQGSTHPIPSHTGAAFVAKRIHSEISTSNHAARQLRIAPSLLTTSLAYKVLH